MQLIRFYTLLTLCVCFGCGGADSPSSPEIGQLSEPIVTQSTIAQSSDFTKQSVESSNESEPGVEAQEQPPTKKEEPIPEAEEPTKKPKLSDLMDGTLYRIRKMPVDEARASALGIRKISGKRLILYTDLPTSDDVDELPTVFEQAVPQWCEYFQFDVSKVADWQMTGFLIKDKNRFHEAKLIPPELPRFLHGYQRGFEFWLYEQPSPYYRRHLMLHEGTHGFMNLVVGGSGPPWYFEGMAELLGTHLWKDGKLTLQYNPKSKTEAPYWGRVKLIRDALREKRSFTLKEIMQLDGSAHQRTEPYAWCWAATTFFDNHPEYRDQFRALPPQVKQPLRQFNQQFMAALGDQWEKIDEQWQIMLLELDYGYDVTRAAIQYKPGEPLPGGGTTVKISADRGWQSAGVRLEKGVNYEISASGRYQIGDKPKIWWCEPGGVTIHYHGGQPLGMLMAALRDDDNPIPDGPYLNRSAPVGLSRELTPTWSGTLYLRINESPAKLADNAGQLTVRIMKK